MVNMDKKQLLKQISENAAEPSPKDRPTAQPKPEPKNPPLTTGKTAAIWLDEQDRAVLREVSVLALNEGLKPSDSVIVKAALGLLPRGPQLLEQIRQVMDRDGRKLRHQKSQ